MFSKGAKGETYDAVISYMNPDEDTVTSTPFPVPPDPSYGGIQKATPKAADAGLDPEEMVASMGDERIWTECAPALK